MNYLFIWHVKIIVDGPRIQDYGSSMTNSETPVNDGSYLSFQVGDGATYSIGSDDYPVTVRRVSANGAVLWTSDDKPRGSVFVPTDGPLSKYRLVYGIG